MVYISVRGGLMRARYSEWVRGLKKIERLEIFRDCGSRQFNERSAPFKKEHGVVQVVVFLLIRYRLHASWKSPDSQPFITGAKNN